MSYRGRRQRYEEIVMNQTQPVKPPTLQSIRTVMEGLTVSGVGAVFVLLWGLQGSLTDQAKQIVKLQTQIEVMQNTNNSAQQALPALTLQAAKNDMQIEETQRRVADLEERLQKIIEHGAGKGMGARQ
jgi:hypothetical protein